jgi:hypothetical protein
MEEVLQDGVIEVVHGEIDAHRVAGKEPARLRLGREMVVMASLS